MACAVDVLYPQSNDSNPTTLVSLQAFAASRTKGRFRESRRLLRCARSHTVRTDPHFASAAIAEAASVRTCRKCFAALQLMSPNPSLNYVCRGVI